MLRWRRIRVPLALALVLSLLFVPDWHGSLVVLYGRLLFIAFAGTIVFGLLERWPARLPAWLARWALQVAGVAIAMPLAVAVGFLVTPYRNGVAFWGDQDQIVGLAFMTLIALLFGPWVAAFALFRQITGAARTEALAARLRLLQAQVEPHFLFNTLANVRELVDAGSPQASPVLGNLIAYLRAAVPRLHEASATLGQELGLVHAYLEVMHMRMPDRLQFAVDADDAVLALHCPPMALLTLVENAVRHGIDPSEVGGRIDIAIGLTGDRCRATVTDTGVGMRGDTGGTGLANLRERLALTFGSDARLELAANAPHGVRAELEFPARRGAA